MGRDAIAEPSKRATHNRTAKRRSMELRQEQHLPVSGKRGTGSSCSLSRSTIRAIVAGRRNLAETLRLVGNFKTARPNACCRLDRRCMLRPSRCPCPKSRRLGRKHEATRRRACRRCKSRRTTGHPSKGATRWPPVMRCRAQRRCPARRDGQGSRRQND